MNPSFTDQFRMQVRGWPLALLRISLGVMFFIAAWHKLGGGARWPDGMVGFLDAMQDKTFGFYRSFLEAVVIPHKVLFAWLVAVGELSVALSFIFGIAVRVGGVVGAFLVINFWFAKGAQFWVPTNHDSLFILISLTLSFSAAGRVLGVDGFLARRWPNKWLW